MIALVITGVIYTLVAYGTMNLPYPDGSIATIWYPNALAICLLLTRPAREWPLHLAALALANLTAGLAAGGSFSRVVLYIPGNLIEILLGAALLRRFTDLRESVSRAEGMLSSLLLGCLVPSAIGAMLSALIFYSAQKADIGSTWTSLFGSSAIGGVAVLPLGLLCLTRGIPAFTSLLRQPQSLLAIAVTLAISSWAPAYIPYPFVFVTASLALIAIIGRFPAVAVALPICSILVGIQLGYNSSAWSSMPRELQDVLIYMPLVLTLLPPVLLATSLERLMLTAEALSDEKETAEVTLHSIGDGVITTDPQGHITYLNPVAEAMLGWPLKEARGCRFDQVVRISDQRNGRVLPDAVTRCRIARESSEVMDNLILHSRDGLEYGIRDSVSPIHAPSGTLLGTVTVIKDVTETRQLASKMLRLAHHDDLTDLPNRVLYQDRLLQACQHGERHKQRFAVMFLDIDHFKKVNDSLGHATGDELLKLVAQRLTATLRESDTISRLGGDEFVILLDGIGCAEAAGELAGKVIEALAKPYTLLDTELMITASLGIALYPDDGRDPSTLMKHADAAMYRAKRDGRNGFHLFSRSADDAAIARLKLENDMRRAIPEGEFILHYQPVIDAVTRKVCSVEALVRWDRGEQGIIRPDLFIPVAEESGLIIPLGQQLLEEACAQLQRWRGTALEGVRIAVNASTVQLREKAFAETLSELLKRYDICGDQLELEITESTLMTDSERMLDTLKGIRALGLGISVDDFGTGYSSLSYLKRFPVSTVKVDRSFVRDMEEDHSDRELIRAILAMSRSLDLKVIAEGVETEGQATILTEMGCPCLQGYLFAKPTDADTLLEQAASMYAGDGSNWII
ncbi:diguanylate cyclase [Marinobacterium lacunae]|uniref:cyclic-guanylate-specific phosphodiesterase n=2 Tax=Marinobacterium lacunae TaxID=1232683 RepID=A0A081FYE3_9GAMM|nr:diguanylate cyclase [Marinobacterium lacunae]